MDIRLKNTGRIVRGPKLVDIYMQDPIPVYNITSVDNDLTAISTSGNVLLSSYPIDIMYLYNRNLGVIATYDLTTSGYTINNNMFVDSNIKRGDIPISGSHIIGRI